MSLSRFALAAALLVAATVAFATPAPLPEENVEPAPAPVYPLPLAIVCIEQPGTSDARPCEPWCDRWIVSHVLRLMIVEQPGEGDVYEWRESDCDDYLAERLPI